MRTASRCGPSREATPSPPRNRIPRSPKAESSASEALGEGGIGFGKGFTIVMVEQNFRFASPLADRLYVVERGRVAVEIAKHEIQARQGLLQELLGV